MGATANNEVSEVNDAIEVNASEINNIEVRDHEEVSAGDSSPGVIDLGAKNRPSYNPEKMYTWDKDAVFALSGNEFGQILNTFRAKVITPEALEYRRLFACNDIMEEVMARGVASGQIVERNEE